MTLAEIKKELAKSWCNGFYIDLPNFSSNERIYLTKNGSTFHYKQFSSGKEWVEKSSLMSSELKSSEWSIREKQ